MPRSGWCRECGEWVWVDDEGGCQHGHSAEAVSRIHDADPQSPPTLGDGPTGDVAARDEAPAAPPADDAIPLSLGAFGVGDFPARLERFNWGAFLLPALWGVVYGVWPIVGLWFAAAFAPLFLSIVFGVSQAGGAIVIPSLIAITVVSDAFLAVARLWTGGSANRLYWNREAVRLRVKPGARPKFTLHTYPIRQRLWVLWGIAGLIGGLGFALVSNYRLMQPYGLGIAFVAEPIVFIAAEIALGVWLGRKMREQNPGTATPAA